MEIMKIAKEPNIHDCEIEKKIKVCASQSLKNAPPFCSLYHTRISGSELMHSQVPTFYCNSVQQLSLFIRILT